LRRIAAMKIQILGPGCANCRRLAERAEQAAQELGLDFELEKVQALDAISAMGVLRTPAMALDARVVHSGSVPSLDRIKELLSEAAS
jgi:small redox-active disulfide protein 2